MFEGVKNNITALRARLPARQGERVSTSGEVLANTRDAAIFFSVPVFEKKIATSCESTRALWAMGARTPRKKASFFISDERDFGTTKNFNHSSNKPATGKPATGNLTNQ
jgi:hypothetical protein